VTPVSVVLIRINAVRPAAQIVNHQLQQLLLSQLQLQHQPPQHQLQLQLPQLKQ